MQGDKDTSYRYSCFWAEESRVIWCNDCCWQYQKEQSRRTHWRKWTIDLSPDKWEDSYKGDQGKKWAGLREHQELLFWFPFKTIAFSLVTNSTYKPWRLCRYTYILGEHRPRSIKVGSFVQIFPLLDTKQLNIQWNTWRELSVGGLASTSPLAFF